ncbi:MAG: sulfatase-like hydrolase/transferase [Verrucomicrobia bacterium]|nr:sulfatase-like hydrolase/transferase [Verrucomicrobiota bacterium]
MVTRISRGWHVLRGLGVIAVGAASLYGAKPANVLVFYLDDMGWAQPGCYGGRTVATPAMDAVAKAGVRFTDGYVSACICGPSRVGLMTGRYQARTGHDANGNRAGRELLAGETTMAQRLKAAGYATGIVGKWHLGDTTPDFLPRARGFDHAIGSISNLGEGTFFRDGQKVDDLPGAPVTTPFYRDEAIRFIRERAGQPWFLYLAFNAVHAPHVASEAWKARFRHLPQREQNYAAMIAEADEAIGRVMETLRALRLEEDTLVFLISDNGGAAPQAEMGGLRGRKWFLWEGGIRVSWIVQWKGRIPAGKVSGEPVIQLDVLPTALAAAGVEVNPTWQLDGTNLLPLLEGRVERLPPRELYFRFGVQYAVRQGDWKLVKASKEMAPMLVNLATDRAEQVDLAAREPGRVRELQGLFDRWNASMQPPRWVDLRWDGDPERKVERREARKAGKKRK